MAKFEIDIFSPDGAFTKEDIKSALVWLMNHDGVVIRGNYSIKEIN